MTGQISYNTRFTAQFLIFGPYNKNTPQGFRMKVFVEFLSLILFGAAYILYRFIPAPYIESVNHMVPFTFTPGQSSDAIYFATLVGILSSALVVITHVLQHREVNKNKFFAFIAFLIFGGATLLIRDPAFIKWKPTVVNLGFALVFFASWFLGKKPLVQRIMGNAIDLPKQVWNKLNLAWILFFVVIAVLNLYIAYNFSEEFWVGFKIFGVLGLTILFLIMQMMLLNRYIIVKPEE